jgi:hypothetical protein
MSGWCAPNVLVYLRKSEDYVALNLHETFDMRPEHVFHDLLTIPCYDCSSNALLCGITYF